MKTIISMKWMIVVMLFSVIASYIGTNGLFVEAADFEKQGMTKSPHIELTNVSDVKLEIFKSNTQGLKIVVKLVSVSDIALEFSPSQLYIEMQDGSKIKEWGFLSFFPETMINVIKGEAIKVTESWKIDSTHELVNKIELKSGGVTKLNVQLKAGVPQEAVLIFVGAMKAKAYHLRLADLPPVQISPKK